MGHVHDNYGPEARRAVEAEALLPTTKWDEEVARGLELGLQGADSIVDRRIPTFSRGELPHFAGMMAGLGISAGLLVLLVAADRSVRRASDRRAEAAWLTIIRRTYASGDLRPSAW